MWPQRTLSRSVSIFVASVAVLTSLAYAQDGKNAPLPVAYTSLGDALVLQGQGADRPWVRLIGVGTPESSDSNKPEAFNGKEVPEVLQAWTRGISIRLVDDPGLPPTSGERRRAYAHRSPDGLDLGLALIQYGFAYARRDYAYERQAAYIAAEKRVRDAGRGYWVKQMPVAVEMAPVSSGSSTQAQSAGPSARSGSTTTLNSIVRVPWGQTDLEFIVEKILNRSDPGATEFPAERFNGACSMPASKVAGGIVVLAGSRRGQTVTPCPPDPMPPHAPGLTPCPSRKSRPIPPRMGTHLHSGLAW